MHVAHSEVLTKEKVSHQRERSPWLPRGRRHQDTCVWSRLGHLSGPAEARVRRPLCPLLEELRPCCQQLLDELVRCPRTRALWGHGSEQSRHRPSAFPRGERRGGRCRGAEVRLAPPGTCVSHEAARADLEKGTWPPSGRQSGVVKRPSRKAPESPGAPCAAQAASWHHVRSVLR